MKKLLAQTLLGRTLMALTLLGVAVPALTPAYADGYAIHPGDTIRIEVLEDSTLNRAVLVDPNGNVSLPEAGTLNVTGQSVDAIAALITSKIAGNFATPPHVYVSLAQVAVPLAGTGTGGMLNIYVIGEANQLGKLSVKSGITALQGFAAMGGFTKFAATKRVEIQRTDPKTGAVKIYKLNYDAITAGSTTDGNMTLQSGDVIIVPQRKLFE